MKFKRSLNLKSLLDMKSFFLFGPRSTGKTTLINSTFPDQVKFDLLDAEVYRKLLKSPKLIEESSNESDLIIIDEIQKLPLLLDEVHRLINNSSRKFLLTGSSARKLKSGGVNLLAGRAWEAQLFPLTYNEIDNFDLLTYLNHGGLPQVYSSKYFDEELESYVNTYLQQEIKAEALTRNIQAFSEFLDLMALSNGEEINYSKFSNDLQVSPGTLKTYVQILEDTLVGFTLPGFTKTTKRKAISRGKHYFFDIGVVNNLTKRGEIKNQSELFGKAFEHFIILELRAYLSYTRSRKKLNYWRSTSNFEVDAIVDEKIAIEIKPSQFINDKHLKGLRALKEENIIERSIVVSQDSTKRTTQDGIEVYPWRNFLDELWSGNLF